MHSCFLLDIASSFLTYSRFLHLRSRGSRVRAQFLQVRWSSCRFATRCFTSFIHWIGDVRKIEDLRVAFEARKDTRTVFHVASLIDISPYPSPLIDEVNIGGVKNVIKLCKTIASVANLMYVAQKFAYPCLRFLPTTPFTQIHIHYGRCLYRKSSEEWNGGFTLRYCTFFEQLCSH